MKPLLPIILAAAACASAWGAPSRMRPVAVASPSGDTVTVIPIGDEHSRLYVDTRGNQVRWIDSHGSRKLSHAMKRIRANHCAAIRSTRFPTIGSRRFLVVLVEFPDMRFSTAYEPAAEFNAMLNRSGYDGFNATGSAADYYRDCSGGLFQPDFVIAGPVTLSENYTYYGSGSDDSRAGLMVTEACLMLDSEIDFSQYDLDGDGAVDNVYFFYAGKGEADGGDPGTIWPHSWNLSDQGRSLTLDGVGIDSYACSPELDGQGKMNGIGTFCHEFAHVLGLPDLYCTDAYAQALAPGQWSLMASGNYNNDGRTPPMLSSYERLELNWLSPKELTHPLDMTLPPLGENRAARIATERANEYFMLENRQQTGWDAYLPGHGMLVWHIDYNPNIWDRNVVNRDPAHQYVDIVEANLATDHRQGAGFTFPGTGNVTRFTSDTRPALRSWSGTEIPLPITDIAETPEGMVTFKVAGGKTPVGQPGNLTVVSTAMERAILEWDAAAAATGHRLTVWKETGPERDTIASLAIAMPETRREVSGLWPGETYAASVTGFDRYEEGPASETVAVEMPAPTFEYTRVIPLAPTDCAPTGFTARWQPLDGAERYLLTVEERQRGEEIYALATFDGKALPDGWQSTSSVWTSMSGYYGDNAPALRLSLEGDRLDSPDLGGQVRSVSFHLRGSNAADGAAVVVEGRAAGNGDRPGTTVTLSEFPVLAEGYTARVTDTEAEIPDGITSVSLVFRKSGKCVANIDDVKIGYASENGYSIIDGYDDLDVGGALSREVTGLRPDGVYFYRVAAISGGARSRDSERMAVRPGTSSITGISRSGKPASVDVVTPGGVVIRRSVPEDSALDGLPGGIYIVNGRKLYR